MHTYPLQYIQYLAPVTVNFVSNTTHQLYRQNLLSIIRYKLVLIVHYTSLELSEINLYPNVMIVRQSFEIYSTILYVENIP